ncbi:MAG: adenosylcobinamide amidohydrolase [Chloroflexi bacterium]|nr:adenosylcobinamide amidohydrolase [Chloroflexota bacterium]
MKTPIAGISIAKTNNVIHVQSLNPLTTLSSAIVGGGYIHTQHIINVNVEKDFFCDDPGAWLSTKAHEMGIDTNFIGLLTAVKMEKARIATFQDDGFTVSALVTAGVSNAACAGVTPPYSPLPGTINMILLLDADLTQAAMLNAVITATEAKTAVLQARNIRTANDDPATGTSTDTVTIAATGNGKTQHYAGPVTTIGWLLARAVRAALESSLSAS